MLAAEKKLLAPPVVIGLNAVIISVTEQTPRVLTVKQTGHARTAQPERVPTTVGIDLPDALPFGPLELEHHQTLERGLRHWVERQTGLQLGYVEQLYTFGDRFRDPGAQEGGPRVISVAYLALVREQRPADTDAAQWRAWYKYFPWEDWRTGPLPIIAWTIQPALEAWVAKAQTPATARTRQERIEITFGLHGTPWDPERVLERYELLYEASLVAEPHGGGGMNSPQSKEKRLGRPMALDHRRILATAVGRIRGKIKYRPVVFELLPPTFTLWQLQCLVEALAGVRLHKQSFRRLVERSCLVERTAQYDTRTGGRPAERFRFRREVWREHAAPGISFT